MALGSGHSQNTATQQTPGEMGGGGTALPPAPYRACSQPRPSDCRSYDDAACLTLQSNVPREVPPVAGWVQGLAAKQCVLKARTLSDSA